MKLKLLGSWLFFILVWIIFWGKWGALPRMGSFFSPSEGYVQQSLKQSQQIPDEIRAHIKGKATIHVDSLGVPYIFAEHEQDLFLLQGYITARDRLFQMEIASRQTAGRLSEWMGASTLEMDRYFRRLGLSKTVKEALPIILSDEETATALEAYSKGVNVYIEQLSEKDYQLEYKLLDAKPERWNPEKTLFILKNITFTLTAAFDDLRHSNTRAVFGDSIFHEIFFKEFDRLNPIISEQINPSKKLKPPFDLQQYFKANVSHQKIPLETDPDNGSNNWAIRGTKTKRGKPILSSDPHLNMSLPSIWYEQSLNTPEFSAHGVIIPGSPGISIGFTPYVSWGVTNTGSDVADFYQIQFKDSTQQFYKFDGKWLPTKKHEEIIYVKDAQAVTEIITYTHHGPVVFDEGKSPRAEIPSGMALRWVAHETGNELKTLIQTMKAKSAKAFIESLRNFSAPALNWAFASSSDTIGMWVNGKIPQKWEHQGLFISDGSDSRYDWQGFIPFEELPHEINPTRNYVSSANQLPAKSDYPFYLDYKMAGFSRPNRINQLLSAKNDFTVEEIKAMQLDSYSLLAQELLPRYVTAMQGLELADSLQVIFEELKDWNLINDGKSWKPSLFHQWRKSIYALLFDEFNSMKSPLSRPWLDHSDWLVVHNPENKWFDRKETKNRETAHEIIQAAFFDAIQLMYIRGKPGENWNWEYVNRTDMQHIARIPGLGSGFVSTHGNSESINAIRENHGPSWRMVVEMDGWNSWAYVTYPGGQSGNPGSKHYQDRLENWRINQGTKVRLYKSSDEMKTAVYTWEF